MKTLSKFKTAEPPVRSSNSLRLASNVTDGETITISNEVYEIDTAASPGAITAGNIRIDCTGGVTPATVNTAIVNAVNANSRLVSAYAIGTNEILFVSRLDGTPRPYTCSTTMVGVNNVWIYGQFAGGTDGFAAFQMLSRSVYAGDVALGTLRFVFSFKVNTFAALVRSSNIVKSWGGTLGKFSLSGSYTGLVLTNNGTVDFAVGDIVTVFASE
jgi:hypothetical protein